MPFALVEELERKIEDSYTGAAKAEYNKNLQLLRAELTAAGDDARIKHLSDLNAQQRKFEQRLEKLQTDFQQKLLDKQDADDEHTDKVIRDRDGKWRARFVDLQKDFVKAIEGKLESKTRPISSLSNTIDIAVQNISSLSTNLNNVLQKLESVTAAVGALETRIDDIPRLLSEQSRQAEHLVLDAITDSESAIKQQLKRSSRAVQVYIKKQEQAASVRIQLLEARLNKRSKLIRDNMGTREAGQVIGQQLITLMADVQLVRTLLGDLTGSTGRSLSQLEASVANVASSVDELCPKSSVDALQKFVAGSVEKLETQLSETQKASDASHQGTRQQLQSVSHEIKRSILETSDFLILRLHQESSNTRVRIRSAKQDLLTAMHNSARGVANVVITSAVHPLSHMLHLQHSIQGIGTALANSHASICTAIIRLRADAIQQAQAESAKILHTQSFNSNVVHGMQKNLLAMQVVLLQRLDARSSSVAESMAAFSATLHNKHRKLLLLQLLTLQSLRRQPGTIRSIVKTSIEPLYRLQEKLVGFQLVAMQKTDDQTDRIRDLISSSEQSLSLRLKHVLLLQLLNLRRTDQQQNAVRQMITDSAESTHNVHMKLWKSVVGLEVILSSNFREGVSNVLQNSSIHARALLRRLDDILGFHLVSIHKVDEYTSSLATLFSKVDTSISSNTTLIQKVDNSLVDLQGVLSSNLRQGISQVLQSNGINARSLHRNFDRLLGLQLVSLHQADKHGSSIARLSSVVDTSITTLSQKGLQSLVNLEVKLSSKLRQGISLVLQSNSSNTRSLHRKFDKLLAFQLVSMHRSEEHASSFNHSISLNTTTLHRLRKSIVGLECVLLVKLSAGVSLLLQSNGFNNQSLHRKLDKLVGIQLVSLHQGDEHASSIARLSRLVDQSIRFNTNALDQLRKSLVGLEVVFSTSLRQASGHLFQNAAINASSLQRKLDALQALQCVLNQSLDQQASAINSALQTGFKNIRADTQSLQNLKQELLDACLNKIVAAAQMWQEFIKEETIKIDRHVGRIEDRLDEVLDGASGIRELFQSATSPQKLVADINSNVLELKASLAGLPNVVETRTALVLDEVQLWGIRCGHLSDRIRDAVLSQHLSSNGFILSQISSLKKAIIDKLQAVNSSLQRGVSDLSALVQRRANTSENILNHLQTSLFAELDVVKAGQGTIIKRIITNHEYDEVSFVEIKRHLVYIQMTMIDANQSDSDLEEESASEVERDVQAADHHLHRLSDSQRSQEYHLDLFEDDEPAVDMPEIRDADQRQGTGDAGAQSLPAMITPSQADAATSLGFNPCGSDSISPIGVPLKVAAGPEGSSIRSPSRSEELLRAQLKILESSSTTEPARATSGKRPSSATSHNQVEKKRVKIGQFGVIPLSEKALPVAPRVSCAVVAAPAQSGASSTHFDSPASVVSRTDDLSQPSNSNKQPVDDQLPPSACAWVTVDIGYKATKVSNKRMTKELQDCCLPETVKIHINRLDKGKKGQQGHREENTSKNMEGPRMCWMSTYMPIGNFEAATNRPSQESECPMCVRRRLMEREVACFYFTSKKTIKLFVPPQ